MASATSASRSSEKRSASHVLNSTPDELDASPTLMSKPSTLGGLRSTRTELCSREVVAAARPQRSMFTNRIPRALSACERIFSRRRVRLSPPMSHSKSPLDRVRHSHSPTTRAVADRGASFKRAISPNTSPDRRTASLSSPPPGTAFTISTAPSVTKKNLSSSSPSSKR